MAYEGGGHEKERSGFVHDYYSLSTQSHHKGCFADVMIYKKLGAMPFHLTVAWHKTSYFSRMFNANNVLMIMLAGTTYGYCSMTLPLRWLLDSLLNPCCQQLHPKRIASAGA